MAYSLLPPNPSGLPIISLHASRAQFLLPYGCVETSRSTRGRLRLKSQVMQSSGTGDSVPSQRAVKSNAGSAGSESPIFSLSNLPSWATWFLGTIFFTAIPLYRRMLVVEETIEETVEKVAEVAEKAAEATEKVAEELTQSLPDGQLKELALEVEKIAEELDKDAEKVEAFLEEVDEMKEKMEKVMDPLLEKRGQCIANLTR